MAGKIQSDETTAQVASEAVVEYLGTSDIRKISAADWKAAGVEGQSQTVWDASNQFKVKISELNKDALELLSKDPTFKQPEA